MNVKSAKSRRESRPKIADQIIDIKVVACVTSRHPCQSAADLNPSECEIRRGTKTDRPTYASGASFDLNTMTCDRLAPQKERGQRIITEKSSYRPQVLLLLRFLH